MKQITFFIMWFGLVLLLPFHMVQFAAKALWAYLLAWFHLSTDPLDAYYERQIELYESKRKALSDFHALM